MVKSLRSRQKQVAREVILQAAADLIVESGIEGVSLAAVAASAGVSKRTLYNHFDNREALFEDLGRWSDELTLESGGFLTPEGLDRLPEMVRAVWRSWAAQGTIYRATLKIGAASRHTGISPGRRRRQAALADATSQVRPDFDAEQAHEIAALLHALASGPVFERLTLEDGLEVDTASSLVAWAIDALRDALERGDDPYSMAAGQTRGHDNPN